MTSIRFSTSRFNRERSNPTMKNDRSGVPRSTKCQLHFLCAVRRVRCALRYFNATLTFPRLFLTRGARYNPTDNRVVQRCRVISNFRCGIIDGHRRGRVFARRILRPAGNYSRNGTALHCASLHVYRVLTITRTSRVKTEQKSRSQAEAEGKKKEIAVRVEQNARSIWREAAP